MLRSGANVPEVLCCPGPFYDGADVSDVCLSVCPTCQFSQVFSHLCGLNCGSPNQWFPFEPLTPRAVCDARTLNNGVPDKWGCDPKVEGTPVRDFF